MHIRVSWPSFDTLEAGSWFCQDAPGLNCSSDACNFSTGRAPRRMRYTDLTWNLLHPTSFSSSPTKTRRTRHKTNNIRTTENRSWMPPWKSPSKMSWPAQCNYGNHKVKTTSGEEQADGLEDCWWSTVAEVNTTRTTENDSLEAISDCEFWRSEDWHFNCQMLTWPLPPSGRTKPLVHG